MNLCLSVTEGFKAVCHTSTISVINVISFDFSSFRMNLSHEFVRRSGSFPSANFRLCLHFQDQDRDFLRGFNLSHRALLPPLRFVMEGKPHPSWTRLSEEFLVESIRYHKCLWDHKDESYMKKSLKRAAYNSQLCPPILSHNTQY